MNQQCAFLISKINSFLTKEGQYLNQSIDMNNYWSDSLPHTRLYHCLRTIEYWIDAYQEGYQPFGIADELHKKRPLNNDFEKYDCNPESISLNPAWTMNNEQYAKIVGEEFLRFQIYNATYPHCVKEYNFSFGKIYAYKYGEDLPIMIYIQFSEKAGFNREISPIDITKEHYYHCIRYDIAPIHKWRRNYYPKSVDAEILSLLLKIDEIGINSYFPDRSKK